MAQRLLTCWTATNTTEQNAQMLADAANGGLPKDNELSVVRVTDTWWMIVGSETAKKWFDEFIAALIKSQEGK